MSNDLGLATGINLTINSDIISDKYLNEFSDSDKNGTLDKGNLYFGNYVETKAYLSKRSILNPELAKKIDRRPSDHSSKKSSRLSDLFPAVMYSMSSRLKRSCDDSFKISCVSNSKTNQKKAFVSNVSRSNNRWLDPVEQKRLAMKDRVRLQRAISYAYAHGLVPILVTFTMQHHWHSLDELRPVLRESRSKMFRGRAGSKLAELIGLHHFVDVFEVTVTDDGGFHPHCHSLLFIDRNKVPLFDLSPQSFALPLPRRCATQIFVENHSRLVKANDSNSQFTLDKRSSLLISPDELASITKEGINPVEFLLKKRWLSLLAASVKKHFGELEFNNLQSSYQNALLSHACVVSRYKKGKNKGKVIRCKDGNYLAKILGVAYDEKAFGVDSELTADSIKDSTIPFDLLRKVSAHNIDMWAEYAISTKGWHKIRLQGRVLNSNLIPTLLEKAAISPQVAANWISEHGFSVLPRPRPPS